MKLVSNLSKTPLRLMIAHLKSLVGSILYAFMALLILGFTACDTSEESIHPDAIDARLEVLKSAQEVQATDPDPGQDPCRKNCD